jgi:hypothetical protein
MPKERNTFYKSLTLKKSFWILTGLGLCSSIPIFKLGPSFILWPSSSEIVGVLLLLISMHAYIDIKSNKRLNVDIKVKKFIPIGILTIAYIFLVTISSTFYENFAFTYPAWSLLRFLQWAVIIPYILFICKTEYITLLIMGIIIGGIINTLVSYMQKFGILVPVDIFFYLGVPGAGPWETLAKEGLIKGESIGLFSFSRIATGFFLVLSFFATMLFLKSNCTRAVILIFFALGIAFTGCRLAGIIFMFMLLALFFHPKFTPSVFFGGFIICIFTLVYFSKVQNNFVLGRIIGISETYSSGIAMRLERQNIIWNLSISQLFWGCGLGNLGSALGLTTLKFYRAHGCCFTYLAEIGFVGVTLFLITIYKVAKEIGAFSAYFGYIISGAILLSCFVDDFMIPSSQSTHLPLIAMIILRFSILKSDRYISLTSKCHS